MEKKSIYYLLPILLGFLIFGSNFLSTDLFKDNVYNFSVWFIMSLLVFSCGWLLNKIFEWKYGGKILFSVIVATVAVTIIMVSLFNEFFGLSQLLTENLILYTLRNIMLGAMGFFGMTLSETLILQKDHANLTQKIEFIETNEKNNQKNSKLIVSEAQLQAERLIFEAKKNAQEYESRLKFFESRLKELIHMEKEIIKQYETEEKFQNMDQDRSE